MHTLTAERAHLTEVDPADLPMIISGHRSALVVLADEATPPSGATRPGDLIYLRTAAGQVVAAGRVQQIENYDDLTNHDLRLLRETHGARTIGSGSVWSSRPDARHATIVWLADVRPVVNASGVPAGLLGLARQGWRTVEIGNDAPGQIAA